MSTSVNRPVLLHHLYDSRWNDLDRSFQQWLFLPVPGEPDTYRIANGGANRGTPIFLIAQGDGSVGFVWDPAPNDRMTHWKVEPFVPK